MNAKTKAWLVATATFMVPTLDSDARGQSYEHFWQNAVGSPATFRVEGPATGHSPDVQGDANLTEVEMSNGETFRFFYMPVGVGNLHYSGSHSHFCVRGGTRTTTGVQGDHWFPNVNMDNPHGLDAGDLAAVAAYEMRMLQALMNTNLNSYVDISSSTPRFSFVLKFNMVVTDDDPEPDDFGEILYFERGAGSGNSWLKMRAVDENGAPLGPWLVVGPNETVQTTPVTAVYRSDQKMGTTSIDVSRLGVTEFQYLEVSNDVTAEPAYTGGGDLAPDFKLMAVMTNAEQMHDVLGLFD